MTTRSTSLKDPSRRTLVQREDGAAADRPGAPPSTDRRPPGSRLLDAVSARVPGTSFEVIAL